MKIAIFNVTATTHFGGLETYAWEVGNALAQRGHQVTIVAGEGGEARNQSVQLQIFPFTPRDAFPKFGTRFRKLMERLSFARQALPWMQAQKFDAIIINKPFDFVALWWARKQGCKAITLFRSGGTDFFQLDRFFASAIDLWLSTSLYNAKQIEARYQRKVTLVPNGVDIDLFRNIDHSHARQAQRTALRQTLGIPVDASLTISIGRLIGWKGLHVVIEAIASIPAMHYLIIGGGGEYQRLRQLAEKLGIQDRVHFAGKQVHDQLPHFLNAADIFVQPSIGEEAFGISVVEAMACGLPVVVSRNGGMVEIVTHEQTGLLLPPGEAAAWRAALQTLAINPVQRTALGEAARVHVETTFTWAANAEKLENLLKECAKCV